jgi:soluble lytic murein transglycosylase-like protein
MTLVLANAIVLAAPIAAAQAAHTKAPLTATQAIVKVFGRHARAALAVARCESGMNPRAVGRAGERGLMQIHPVHFGWVDEARLFDPLYNARIAYRLSRDGTSWAQWTCKP